MRILNDVGLARFQAYIEAGAIGNIPWSLLDNEETSIDFLLYPNECPNLAQNSTKTEVSIALVPILEYCNIQALLFNREFWGTLALIYFDLICPADINGTRKVGQLYRYIPPAGRSYKNYYRHLLRTPTWIQYKYGENAKALLSSAPNKGGDLIEQVASRQEVISNKGIVDLLDTLYFDNEKNTIKKGVTSQSRPGGLRRLINIVQQLELTYDLHAMDNTDLIDLLPAEFNEWIPASENA